MADKKPKPTKTAPPGGDGGDTKSPFTDPKLKQIFSTDVNKRRPRT